MIWSGHNEEEKSRDLEDVRGLATWVPGGTAIASPRVARVCLVNLSSRELGSFCRVKGWQVVREGRRRHTSSVTLCCLIDCCDFPWLIP